jgi:predicted small lipoprotein YifL
MKKTMIFATMMASGLLALGACGQKPPLLPEKDVAALANELSGETAKRNLEGLARLHRQRGSRGFHAAAELVAERLRAYGLGDVAILQFPADGQVFYGTQRSRPAWDAEFGELWEAGGASGGCVKARVKADTRAEEKTKKLSEWLDQDCDFLVGGARQLASYEAEPIVLAEDSESAQVTAELVDVGAGTKESDYAGKDVKGKIVLVSAPPGAVQDGAVGKFGAAGMVSYAQNQKTAWSGEDENLIRWGHLETFSANKTFAFMVSLKTARGFRERLAAGEKILLHAMVKAGQHPGNYEVVTAAIPGADQKLKDEEIAFSCHLDHQRPGANDNASGCVTILEVARTLQKLIADGNLARPSRTIRFIFPPEVEGTMALLNGKPEFAKRIKAVIHMDMVGGGPETKAVFHVTRGPMSLPSFVHDVAWAFAEWLNEESYNFAAGLRSEYPMVAPEGGKEPLRAEYSAFTMGSDHDVYQDSSFGIPAIYLNDWPDRYIHTNFDTAANIDTTKLKRAAFIGAASGYFLAKDFSNGTDDISLAVKRGELLRRGQKLTRDQSLQPEESEVAKTGYCEYESEIDEQLWKLKHHGESLPEAKERMCWTDHPGFDAPREEIAEKTISYRRKPASKGPVTVFGYDYFADRAKALGAAEPKLLRYEGLWGHGEEYAYEVLNLAGTTQFNSRVRIWEIVSAEYGPVPYEMVVEYLKALEKIGIVEQVQ